MKVLLDESTPRRLASLQELRPLVAEVIAVLSGDLERRIYRVVA